MYVFPVLMSGHGKARASQGSQRTDKKLRTINHHPVLLCFTPSQPVVLAPHVRSAYTYLRCSISQPKMATRILAIRHRCVPKNQDRNKNKTYPKDPRAVDETSPGLSELCERKHNPKALATDCRRYEVRISQDQPSAVAFCRGSLQSGIWGPWI